MNVLDFDHWPAERSTRQNLGPELSVQGMLGWQISEAVLCENPWRLEGSSPLSWAEQKKPVVLRTLFNGVAVSSLEH